jgi:hypothetical protein
MPLTLLLASLLSVLSWTELDPAEPLWLRQEIKLGEVAYAPGTRFSLLGREPLGLPGAPLVLFHLRKTPCEQPQQTHGMEIVVPEGGPEASSVGVELETGCRWSVYVEQKDLLQPSLFSAEHRR